MIKKKKSTSKIVSAISAVIAAALLTAAVFVSGCTAYNVNDKNESALYISDEFGMSLEIPAAWRDKYVTETEYYGEHSALLIFAQKATHEKYDGAGVLFRIEKVSIDSAEEILNMLGGSRLLYSDDEYAYIFETPTDVQYPIWSDRDEEDIAIAEEYEEMFKDVDSIRNSIEFISVVVTKQD